MGRNKIERINVELPVGLEGVCGNPSQCAIANQIRSMGYLRPKVGTNTISFADPCTNERITIETPREARMFVLEFDRSNNPGDREVVTEAISFQLPLGGKTVTRRPIVPMSQEAKDKLNAQRDKARAEDPDRLPREALVRAKAHRVAKARAS